MARAARAVVIILLLCPVGQGATAQSRSRPDPPPTHGPIMRLTEPRVPPLPSRAWTDDDHRLAGRYASLKNTETIVATLLRAPELAESVRTFFEYTSLDSSLSPRHRAILILRTAWVAQSDALWSAHAAHAAQAGLTSAELRRIAVGSDADGWDAFEARLMGLVDELYINSSVTDATWAAISSQYDLLNMVDAVMTVAEWTTLSVLLNSLGVQPGGAVLRMPDDVVYRVVVPTREPPLTTPRIDPMEGDGLRVTRTIRRHPRVTETWRGNTNYVNRLSPLTPHDRELLILRIGWNCQAEYEWAKHVGSVGRARDHGLEPRRIAEGPDAAGWRPHEVALLEAADEMYRDGMVADRTWATLATRYNTHEMMSIVMTVATYRFVSMTLNSFGVQIRSDDEGFPSL